MADITDNSAIAMIFLQAETGVIFGFLLAIILLLIISAFISGSESAIFSLQKKDLILLPDNKAKENLEKVVAMPKRILATILFTNNTVNVAFVLIAARFIERYIHFNADWLKSATQVIIETLLLLIFGEVIPKIYATTNHVQISLKVSPILLFLRTIFAAPVQLMVWLSSFFDKRMKTQAVGVSIDELTHAIDITSEEDAPKEEKEILKSIIKFGNKTAKQILTSRSNIEAIEKEVSFDEVIKFVTEKGFSRMPVIGQNLDEVEGVLYAKDLLKYSAEQDKVVWQTLIKPAFFIPEKKRIDDLLTEFQEKRIHMAIVVDEFGGTIGLVTMEDILEQIFGEIMDEFDEEDTEYIKTADNIYIFSAQTLLTDFIAITKISENIFDLHNTSSDTLAGLVMELFEKIPKKGMHISLENLDFTIESASLRKINKIKVTINEI